MMMPPGLVKKRLIQVLGILVTLFGGAIAFVSLSLLSGMLSVNFGPDGPPLWFIGYVFGGVPFGALIIWLGVKLVAWGMSPPVAE